MSAPTVMVVYGTRPEAIKMAPLVLALRADGRFRVRVVVTGQHREMVDAIHDCFGIVPDADLAAMRPGQRLDELGSVIMERVGALLAAERPDAVVVHGDTSSAAMTAMAAYYAGVQVVHLEAGLRSGDLHSPFPEEGNRRVIGQLAELHLAPTAKAALNLVFEQVPADRIAVTGNTVIDALRHVAAQGATYRDVRIQDVVDSGSPVVVVTAHRRESWGAGLVGVARGVADVIEAHPEIRVVLPLHPNPIVRDAIEPILDALPQAILTEPLDYPEFSRLLGDARCVLTDSGGIQEEAPSLGKPVLVTRDTTERPEVLENGAARLIGTERARVATELGALLEDQDGRYGAMAAAGSPYGDGRAAARAAAAIAAHLGVGVRLPDFSPTWRADARLEEPGELEDTTTGGSVASVPIEDWA